MIRELQMRFGLSLSLAKALDLLMDKKYATLREIEALQIKDGRGTIHRLRKALEQHGIVVHRQRDVGYWLNDLSKRQINRMLDNPER